jgi:hypothetical protein
MMKSLLIMVLLTALTGFHLSAGDSATSGFPLENPSQESPIMRQQHCLARLGFNPGPIDGQWGTRSQAAMTAWTKREFPYSWQVVGQDTITTRFWQTCTKPARSSLSQAAGTPGSTPMSKTSDIFGWIGLIIFLIVLGLVVLPAYIADRKGRSFSGFFVYSLFLWPIALIYSLIMTSTPEVQQRGAEARGEIRRCPACAELVQVAALRCKHCGEPLMKPSPDSTSRERSGS